MPARIFALAGFLGAPGRAPPPGGANPIGRKPVRTGGEAGATHARHPLGASSSLKKAAGGPLIPSGIEGVTHNPSSPHIASTRCFTASSMTIGVPHSRFVSPGHLLVASNPILEPRPATGLAKSR